MKATIFGSFEDPAHAEKAAGALLDHGLHDYDISLLVHPGEYKDYPAEGVPFENVPASAAVRQTPGGGYAYADSPTDQDVPPIQSGSFSTNTIQPTPSELDVAAAYQGQEPTPGSYTIPSERTEFVSTHEDMTRTPLSATTGLSTTTGTDAGLGAAKGAAVGLGVGVIAALAAVFVPGVGLVAGAGALASAVAGAAGATGAGAIAGGAIGYLKDQGVPEDALTVYRDAYGNGGAILGVNLPEKFNRAEIEAIMAKYGAQNIDMYGDYEA